MSMTVSASKPTVWHPFTQQKTAPLPLKVKRGNGIYLELEDGRKLIDCISSWWVNIHGHSHPSIARAIFEQAQKLEHVIFAGFTHEPAEELAGQLLKHLPSNLKHVFYSDNGSTSVEVALKMACQYWYNQGQKRQHFIAFEGGYHGDTFGAMSAGRTSPFWQPFESMLFQVDTIPFPTTYENDGEVQNKEELSLNKLESYLQKQAQNYAAIIIEPLIQGAAGMRMCRSQFLYRLQLIAKQFGIPLIYDEVMTGFGRTGEWFACVKSNTQPDIICLSKGITGGFLPLSATIVTENIFDKFYSDDIQKTFFHGHSYTANPLACAAAIASFKLLEDNPEQFRRFEKLHRKKTNEYLQTIADAKKIRQIRFCGTVVAFDINIEENTNYFASIGTLLKEAFLKRNLLIRPLGNTVYLMPPYCIEEGQLDNVYRTLKDVLQESS